MNEYHLVLSVPAFKVSFYAVYGNYAEALDNAKELWGLLSGRMKLELMVPPDNDTFFGIYDRTCAEGEWLWEPEPWS